MCASNIALGAASGYRLTDYLKAGFPPDVGMLIVRKSFGITVRYQKLEMDRYTSSLPSSIISLHTSLMLDWEFMALCSM